MTDALQARARVTIVAREFAILAVETVTAQAVMARLLGRTLTTILAR